jgi:parvulin-like peptidyl-prolyl isomerase
VQGGKIMKNKFCLSLAIIVIFALVLGGCSANAYVVKVNDEKIMKKDFDNKLNDVKTSLQAQGIDFTTEEGKTTLQSVQEELIGMLIQGAILKQEVKKNNWDTAISQITDKINQLSTQNGGDLASALKQQGLTEDDLRNALAFSYYVGKDTTVSDEEVKAFFENNLDQYGGQMEQVKARHILVATEDEAKNIIKQIQAGTVLRK